MDTELSVSNLVLELTVYNYQSFYDYMITNHFQITGSKKIVPILKLNKYEQAMYFMWSTDLYLC